MQTRVGQSIEDASMEMIDREAGPHDYDSMEWPVVRRIIHSTADFDYIGANRVMFHPDAIRSGMRALVSGCHIITDVNGIPGLLNKRNLAEFGNVVTCRISEERVASLARERDSTRARVSMRESSPEMAGGVVVVGNAPTALLEVMDMIREGAVRPALVVGVPVGFVQAAESKAELETIQVPYITNRGRKGGSPVAAAIINALFKLARSSP
jgi:precorrin-8X/cobalt-precorrin-8 methylmutase